MILSLEILGLTDFCDTWCSSCIKVADMIECEKKINDKIISVFYKKKIKRCCKLSHFWNWMEQSEKYTKISPCYIQGEYIVAMNFEIESKSACKKCRKNFQY